MSGDSVVGAVGVSGGTGEQDQAVASRRPPRSRGNIPVTAALIWVPRHGRYSMPTPVVPARKLGFLTIGLFDGADPRPGHESTLEIIELGERLGLRQRLGAPPAPAVRHLLAGRRAGRRVAAHHAASNWARR